MAGKKEKGIEQLFNEMSLLNFEIGSHFYAKPTYIADPQDFYIIPFPFLFHLPSLSKPGNPVQIENLKEKMTVVYSSKNPDVNKYFKIDLDENIRGVIQRIGEDNKCIIHALDRGFIENDVTLDRIFHPACEAALTVPSLIQHCGLHSCAPIGDNFSKESIEAFKFFIGNEKLSIVIRGMNEDKLSIVVYNTNPDDISTLLALTHYTYLTSTIKNDLDSLSIEYSAPVLAYQHAAVSLGDILTVRVQSGATLKSFYVTPMAAYNEYLENRANFTNYCKCLQEISASDYKKDTLVGVLDNASYFYERGVILDVLGTGRAKVKLVDWGLEIIVPKSRVKAIKTEFYVTQPVKALYCSAVEGFVPWDNGLPHFLYKGYTFMIKVTKVGRGFETPHIVALAQS